MSEALLGPLGMAALALIVIGLFLRGTILSRNTVPREDYDKLVEINKENVEAGKAVAAALNELIAVVRHQQQNGGAR